MKDKVLALAGMLQAIALVQQMANNGHADTGALGACVNSLFRFDAGSTEEIYGGAAALRSGLRRVIAQLDGDGRDPGQTRIAMNLLHLERRFASASGVADAVRADLDALLPLLASDGATHPQLLAKLGELYAQRISPLGPRVMVQGNPVYLGQPVVVGEVRATLLAALRSAVLWRQLGGSWWDLLLQRRHLVETARELLGTR
ncbi:high frequency lysogenization protein HflD [soil metagenome]